MDLKFYDGKRLLHTGKQFTKLSASTVIQNKNPETKVKDIVKIWTIV